MSCCPASPPGTANFNRAFLLLVDEGGRCLQGEYAIGPPNGVEAGRIWQEMRVQAFTLERVLAQFDAWEASATADHLNAEFRRLALPLPLESPMSSAHAFFQHMAAALAGQPAELFNDDSLAVPGTTLRLRHFARVPLQMENRVIGVLLVDNAYNLRPIQRDELDELTTLANLAAIAVERARLHEQVRRMADRTFDRSLEPSAFRCPFTSAFR